MVTELVLTFKDAFVDGDDPLEFTHTLTAPEGFEVTGGQLFVERVGSGELDRFSFRIDRDTEGKAELVIMENVRDGA